MRRATRSRFAVAALSVLVIVCFSIASLLGAFATQSDRDSGPQGAETQAIDSLSFTIQMSPATGASVGDVVTFFVNATSDIPSANLSFRIYFDARLATYANNTASGYAVGVTGNPGQFVTTYTYSAPGNWTDVATGRHYVFVRAYVQDNASTTINKQMTYFVNYNAEPLILGLTPHVSPSPGIPGNLSLMVMDLDNDTLTVTWDFGDGSTAIDILTSTLGGAYSNQTHAWSTVIPPGIGDYWVNCTINVTIEDGHSHWTNDSVPMTMYIPPNRPPVPRLWIPSQFWEDMEPVAFEASARDAEGDGIFWYFDFGDGFTLSDYTGPTTANVTVWNNQTHAYADLGNGTTYNATLFTTDGPADHNMSSGQVQIVIAEDHPPVVTQIISHVPETLEIPVEIGYLNVTFKIQVFDIDGDGVTATWEMGDGSPARVNVTGGGVVVFTLRQWRNFTNPGEFSISVVVTDGKVGHEVTCYLNATMSSTNRPPELTQAPTWTYHYGDYAVPNETIQFSMRFSDPELDDLTVVWDLGDGSPILVLTYDQTDYVDGNITCNVSHAYGAANDYTMHIWVSDNKIGRGQHNVSLNASVQVRRQMPSAVAGDDQVAFPGQKVEFNATTNVYIPNYNYTWTFTYDGDVVTLYGVTASFTFEIPGTYQVTLTMSDDVGSSATDTMTVTVQVIDEFSDLGVAVSFGAIMGVLMVTSAMRRAGRTKEST